jgi:diaminohydroxyphosphoribosylaminopyrimidine deaminase/5-amino-6-(5-phosphoribosylamino)uracil reductase
MTVARGQPTELDRRFMAAAISLGWRNAGLARPHPSVGAILVRKGPDGFEVIARAVSAPGGRPHAEALVLAAAGERARGATLYVTLEPCLNGGAAPSCVTTIVNAGVAHVVVGIEDPDPRYTGRGLAVFERNGIRVTSGVHAGEAALLHAGHIALSRLDRPHVHLRLMLSADGCVERTGEGTRPIASAAARAHGFGMRLLHDAVMVGCGTIVADDPRLTARLPGCETRSPVRVVIDAEARTPPDANVVALARTSPTWIFVAPDAPEERVRALAQRGVLVLTAERESSGRIDLADVLFQMGRLGIGSVLAEGGARLSRSLLEAGMVDEATVITSEQSAGGEVPDLPLTQLSEPGAFRIVAGRSFGDDRLLHLARIDGRTSIHDIRLPVRPIRRPIAEPL